VNKFIFVCYDHGCGGENLSVQISKRPYCNTLEHTMHNSRTWSNDVFHKLFLKTPTENSWQNQIPCVPASEKFYVIPSHFEPDELVSVFKDSIFVVINFPTSSDSLLHLQNGIYEKVWLSSHTNIKQKIGFCKQQGYDITTQEQLKQINNSVNNAHIHCIMNNLEFTEENTKHLYSKMAVKITQMKGMNYIDNDQTIVLEYNNTDMKKLDRLDELCILHR